MIVLVPAIWWNRTHPLAQSGDLALRNRTVGAADEPNPAVRTEATLAKVPAASVSEPTVNLADNPSTRVLQGHAATEFPSQVSKGLADKEIAAAKIQAAPAAAPSAGADIKAEPDRIAVATPPVAQPSSTGNLAMTQQFSQQSAVQSFRNNAQVNRSANVLNTFQVQQQGSEIRVLDADGSTYTGKIEQLPKNAELNVGITARRDAAKQTQRYAAKAARENESAAPQSYFRATGYNVSLKKTLVFEGNYAAPPAQQPATVTGDDRERSKQNRDRARIVGTVRVNGEAAVEVDAIADTPEAAATKKSEK